MEKFDNQELVEKIYDVIEHSGDNDLAYLAGLILGGSCEVSEDEDGDTQFIFTAKSIFDS